MEQTQQEQQKSETEKSSEVLGVDKIQGVAKELKVDPKVLLDKFLPIIEEITKSKIDDKVAVVKDQLYKTIEQLKLGKTDSDAKLAELNEYVQKIKDAEAASLKKLEDDKVAEQEEKKTTKQRLAELSEKLENQASNYEKKLLAIKLSGIRKEAIALAQNSIIPELIPDPEVTDISLENLLKAIEFSKAKFLEIAAKANAPSTAPQSFTGAAVTQQTPSQVPDKTSFKDLSKMSKQELAEYALSIGK